MSAHDWITSKLPEALSAKTRPVRFAPVAQTVAHRTFEYDVAQQVTVEEVGTGFLVHPRAAVTAAHVATFPVGGGRRAPATGIALDFGSIRVWGTKFAVLRRYLSQTNDADDMAVILLRDEVETLDAAMIPAAQPPTSIEVSVWGRSTGSLDPRDARARRDGPLLSYDLPDMPGHSGGPVASPQRTLRRAEVCGVHVAFDGRGKAAPVFVADLRDALISLGFDLGGTN